MLTLLAVSLLAPAHAGPATTELDDAGRVVRSVSDADDDGRPELVVTWEYADDGTRTVKRLDDDGDGVVDRVFHYDPGCVTPYDACTGRFERATAEVAVAPVVEPEPYVPWGPTAR